MRLAYCSPLPPQPSGIADYSAELLPALAEHVDEIELYVAAGVRPDAGLAKRFTVRPLTDLERRADRLDAVLYHLGNDVRYHGELYEQALRLPGVVVLHEVVLNHLVYGLTVERQDPEGYVAAMERCYGLGGERAARRILDMASVAERWHYPLFEEVVDASRGVIVHSGPTRDRILASRPEAAVEVVPHHLCLDALPEPGVDRRELRCRLRLPEETLLVGSFGFLTAAKRLRSVLAGFQRLRREHAEARLLLVGDPEGDRDLPGLLGGDAGEGVEVLGRVPLDRFLELMRSVDVAVNLRWPTGGETSGTVMRLLGLGTPTVVSDAGAFSELPDDVCVKVPVDGREVETLAAALMALAGDRQLRRRLGERGAGYMAGHHTLAGSARRYAAALGRMAGRQALHPARSTAERRGPDAALVADVGAALHDLGIEEGDADVVGAVAAAVRDLGVE